MVFAAVAAALCLGLVGLVHHLQWQAEASWLPPANAASLLPARLPLPDMDPHEPPLSVPPGYVPVRLGPPAGARTQVQLCRPDFAAYSREPWRYPMFRDLAATCSPADTIARTLQQLAMQFAAAPPPAGLVFHQSRVGSTLLCNLLAADAQALVYAEAGVPAQIVAHCTDCTPDTQVSMLAHGRLPGSKHNTPVYNCELLGLNPSVCAFFLNRIHPHAGRDAAHFASCHGQCSRQRTGVF